MKNFTIIMYMRVDNYVHENPNRTGYFVIVGIKMILSIYFILFILCLVCMYLGLRHSLERDGSNKWA